MGPGPVRDREARARKPAILTVKDEYGRSGHDIMTRALESAGVKPVAVEAMATGDRDVTGQLPAIQRAGADVLLTQIHRRRSRSW